MADADTIDREAGNREAEQRASAEGREDDARRHNGTLLKKGEDGKHGKPDRKELIIMVATVLGVIIAFISFKRSGSSSSAAATDPTAGANLGTSFTPTGSLGSGDVAGSGSSDTGDPFAGLESRLDEQSTLLSTINNTLAHPASAPPTGKAPAPSSAPKAAAKPAAPHFIYGKGAKSLKFIFNRRTGKYGEVQPTGSVYWLNTRQYAELGRPKAAAYGRTPAQIRAAAHKKPTPRRKK